VLAALKREQPLGSVLNHWDEAVAYTALCCLIVTLDFHVLSWDASPGLMLRL